MKKYEHIQNYQIKFCEVDYQDRIKISAILAYLEEIACLSAEELGFGYRYVRDKGCAFMVSNILCEFEKPICLGEMISFKTWPLQPSYAIFERVYQACDSTGEIKMNATSRWCLIDMKTGKILPSKVIDNQDYTAYNTTRVFEKVNWKIPTFSLAEGELKYALTVAYSDYDHNQHVNNTKYADYCMNCFSVSELINLRVKTFAISYVKQCKEGERLRFYRKQYTENEYFVQGVNEKDEIVVQTRFVFAPQTTEHSF